MMSVCALSPALSVVDVGVTAFMLPDGNISVTCPDVSLNCLVLVQSTTNNPDEVHVGHINSSEDRTIVLSPGTTNVSVVVYTWNNDSSIFNGSLSHICLLSLLPSTSELYGVLTYIPWLKAQTLGLKMVKNQDSRFEAFTVDQLDCAMR